MDKLGIESGVQCIFEAMKILLVNATDTGGAAVSTFRIYECLKAKGLQVRVLLQKAKKPETIANSDVFAINNKSIIAKIKYALRLKAEAKLLGNKTNNFSTGFWGISIHNHPWVQWADIVHLNWINDSFLKIRTLSDINKPIIWTLHDMWPFTVGYHYMPDDESILPAIDQVIGDDIPVEMYQKVWLNKSKTYQKMDFTIAGSSTWLTDLAKKAPLFKDKNVVCLPTPVNTEFLKVYDSKKARKELNLPSDKKVLLFGSFNVLADKRKGFAELKEALIKLDKDKPELKNYIVLSILGRPNSDSIADIPFECIFLGFKSSEESIMPCYHAADLFVLPSLQDNLPNMCLESLACGTPVVAFNIGGVPDMVKPPLNGFLANSVNEMAEMIDVALNKSTFSKIEIQDDLERRFGHAALFNEYKKLYSSLLT